MTIAVGQTVFGTDASTTGTTAAVTLTVASTGSSLHFWATVDSFNASDFTTISSSPALTWGSALDNINDATNVQRCTHYKADSASAGSITVTINISPTNINRGAACKEITGTSGYDTTAGTHAGANQTSTTPTSGAMPAFTSQPALISGWCMNVSTGNTPVAGSGFTSDGSGIKVGGATNLMTAESKRVTVTTGAAATFTDVSASHITLAAGFLETAASSGSVRLRFAAPLSGVGSGNQFFGDRLG